MRSALRLILHLKWNWSKLSVDLTRFLVRQGHQRRHRHRRHRHRRHGRRKWRPPLRMRVADDRLSITWLMQLMTASAPLAVLFVCSPVSLILFYFIFYLKFKYPNVWIAWISAILWSMAADCVALALNAVWSIVSTLVVPTWTGRFELAPPGHVIHANRLFRRQRHLSNLNIWIFGLHLNWIDYFAVDWIEAEFNLAPASHVIGCHWLFRRYWRRFCSGFASFRIQIF